MPRRKSKPGRAETSAARVARQARGLATELNALARETVDSSTPASTLTAAQLRDRLRAVAASMRNRAHGGGAAGTGRRERRPRGFPPEARQSAANLLHYLGMREHDLRDLHGPLSDLGLSSLGRAEAHALRSVLRVLEHLERSAPDAGNERAQPKTMGGTNAAPAARSEPAIDLDAPTRSEGAAILARRTEALLGPSPAGRRVRIMVTMPTEAATDPAVIRGLLASGMDVMRINCAHDTPEAWRAMVANLRRAERELVQGAPGSSPGPGHGPGDGLSGLSGLNGRVRAGDRSAARSADTVSSPRPPVRVFMDIGGPKTRTGAIAPGPRVAVFRPRRDALGRVSRPARIIIRPASAGPRPTGDGATLLLNDQAYARLRNAATAAWRGAKNAAGAGGAGGAGGAVIRGRDARGRRIRFRVVLTPPDAVVVESNSTAYITPALWWRLGGPAERREPGRASRPRAGVRFRFGPIAAQPGEILLRAGDDLLLTTSRAPGMPAARDASGRAIGPARIPFTLPGMLRFVRVGHSVWLDDGKIGGRVIGTSRRGVRVRIESVRAPTPALDAAAPRPAGSIAPAGLAPEPAPAARLLADKGVNFPDTQTDLSPLTAKDRRDLRVVAQLADAVGYSFVSRPRDVAALRRRLAALGRAELGIVLKIETRRAFEHLPELLLELLRGPGDRCGVMIARGDLAVECGWERLAEVQEEILWLGEAAHVPVIWATQVLERLAKKGQPSRAEITDAAQSQRAECVMLNKGPYIEKAVRTLDDILRRMGAHHAKRVPVLRPLRVAQRGPR